MDIASPVSSPRTIRYTSSNIARVYGEILHVCASPDHPPSERIVVACPFCHRVHLHEPSRSPVTQALRDITPRVRAPPTAAMAMTDHVVVADSSDSDEDDDDAPDINWQTDRVATCKRGTYHIVGWANA